MNKETITILLVEDDALIGLLEKQNLENSGYTVCHVLSGEAAVEAVLNDEIEYNLVIMDIDLGDGIDGTQAAELILQHGDIPILFLSSHTEREIVEKTERITSYGYVVKNTGFVVLDASIKMALKLFNAKTERIRAEEKLTASELKYRTLVENIPQKVFLKDTNSVYISCNNSYAESLMIPSDEISGRTDYDFYPTELAEKYRADDQRIIQTGSTERIEERFIEQKKEKIIETQKTPVKDDNGNIIGVLGIFHDITGRKRAEDQLLESEDRYRNLVQNLYAGVVVHAPDTRIIMANDRASILLGLTIDQMKGKAAIDPSWRFIREDSSVMPLEEYPVNKVIATNAPLGDQIVGINRPVTRDVVWVQINAFPEYDAGENLKQVVVTFVDITERKNAENTLRESEERFRVLYENMNEGVALHELITDENGVPTDFIFLGVNPTYEALTGLKGADIIGKRGLEVIPNIEKKWIEAYGQVALTGEPITIIDHSEYLDKYWEVKAFSPKKMQFAVAMQDITERKHAELEIHKQLAEKEILLREVHHRVKNNIANIEGLLALQANASTSTEVKESLHEAVSRVRGMRILYEKMLLENDYHEISIKGYVENIIDSLVAINVINKNTVFENQIDEFTIDSRRAVAIGIIINELVTNVFKYAFVDQESGYVLVSMHHHNSTVTISVRDNGNGNNDTDRLIDSPGFGLTIVKMLVDQLNGKYRIANGNGKGIETLISFQL